MGKRGRKYSPHSKRNQPTRSGRKHGVEQNDHIIAQRIRTHGMPEVGTEHPLDILAAKGLLATPEERNDRSLDIPAINAVRADAGHKLASLHGRIHGPNAARAQDVNRAAKDTGLAEPTVRDENDQARYMTMRATLHALGRGVMDCVYNVAVYKRPIPFRGHERALENLRVGLAALAGELVREDEDRARRPMQSDRTRPVPV